MDFPIFHLDIFGNRGLVATIAVLHVLVNHSLAVGMMPLVACMEWYGHKRRDPRWDKLAYNILFVAFLITTTVGAMTGIGIWLSVSLVNPYSIGSLIRVFFWAWFTEWLVFVTEVCLILAYTLTWKKWSEGRAKERHIRLGFTLGFFSWVTMALIVAILGFMMDPGNWMTEHTLWSGIANPIYLPQLAFRTPLAAAMAGVVAMFLAQFFTRGDAAFRNEALRAIALWTLFFAPFVLIAGFWYYSVVPDVMKENFGVAIATLQFTDWQQKFLEIALITVVVILVAVQVAIARPNLLPRVALLAPLVAVIWMIGHFERVREFVRKPYVIGRYMYANGFRVDDYPLLQRDGVLAHATYSNPLTDAERAGPPGWSRRGGARGQAGALADGQGRLHADLLAVPHRTWREQHHGASPAHVRRPALDARADHRIHRRHASGAHVHAAVPGQQEGTPAARRISRTSSKQYGPDPRRADGRDHRAGGARAAGRQDRSE